MPICDAHHHLWQRPRERYLLNDLLVDLRSGHRISSTVAVECGYGYHKNGPEQIKPIGEVTFLDEIAGRVQSQLFITTRIAGGIVGFAHSTLGRCRRAGARSAHDGKPEPFPWHPPLDHLGRQRRAAQRSATGNVGGWQIPQRICMAQKIQIDLRRLALSSPAPGAHRFGASVSRCYDHSQSHRRAPGRRPTLAGAMKSFNCGAEGSPRSRCPNIVVKLGGVGSARSGYDWHQRAVPPSSEEIAGILKPYFEYCIEKFGVERCMFESNFPVEKRSNSYVVVWNAFKRISKNFSAAERAASFHDTATRAYRIK